MKTARYMFSTICSFALLAGCVGPMDGISEEGEALGDEVAANDEAVESSAQALEVCTSYPVDSGGGERTSASGCFTWGDTFVSYTSKGAVNNSGSMPAFSTPAKVGDFEILALGASNGGDNSLEVNTYFDKSKMEGQAFQAIGVRGSQDKKIELWIRKNNGQTTINPPSKSKSYNVFVVNGSHVRLDMGTITKNTVQGASSSTWTVPSLADATRLNVLAYYGDDNFEVLNSGGEMIFNKWGFGDGDSLNVMFYEVHDTPPATISVKKHDTTGGSEYVGIRAHFLRL